ncbi:hypothetical protein [Haloechinothrix halophila]|uniref:hypothetical protein n=1 Tax=Haloechinothrix halophila TaxID=1069073 RepID=UPI00041563D7|nr:hypothetical protein [Haloechinothrix halophila]
MKPADFRRELERRLAIIEDPEHRDPATDNLPRGDWIALLIGCVVLIGAALAWGYPW